MVDERAARTELTQLAGRALTPDYASPEQLRGEALGVASDVYSLGVLAYELLAGASPYRLERRSAATLEQAVLDLEVPPASARATTPARARELRGDLDAILAKALQKDPAARYASVEALASDWRRHLAGESIAARRDRAAARVMRWLRRHRRAALATTGVLLAFGLALGAGAMALVLAVLLAGLALALWQARAAREQARIARVEARIADAVLAFVEGLFRANSREQADPLAARRRSAEQLLQEGAARIDGALLDTPEARLRVLRTLAAMHLDIGRSDDAIRLAGECAALAEQLHGAGGASHLRALLDWARMLIDSERQQAAADVLARAQAAIAAMRPVDADLAIDLDLAQALHHSYRRDAAGLAPAERAVQALSRAGPSLRLLQGLRLQGAMLGEAGRPPRPCRPLKARWRSPRHWTGPKPMCRHCARPPPTSRRTRVTSIVPKRYCSGRSRPNPASLARAAWRRCR
jgi:serine/threonine-protein kinase